MIECEIEQNGNMLMHRTFYDRNLTLETVIKQMEMYVVNEQLNTDGECYVRVRFANLGMV